MTGGSCCAGCWTIIWRLRALREQRLEEVVGDEGVRRARVEAGHERALETVFGTVSVGRLAYRAPGVGNLHPADAALNLPIERHSHGLRKLAGLEAARGSFQDAVEAIERATGLRLGKRQVEELATLAAMDFEDFYEARRPARCKRGDLLVLSADGKGIVMRPDALRPAPADGQPARAPNRWCGYRARISATASGWRRSARSTTPRQRPAPWPTSLPRPPRRATSRRPARSPPTSGCAPASSRTPAP